MKQHDRHENEFTNIDKQACVIGIYLSVTWLTVILKFLCSLLLSNSFFWHVWVPSVTAIALQCSEPRECYTIAKSISVFKLVLPLCHTWRISKWYDYDIWLLAFMLVTYMWCYEGIKSWNTQAKDVTYRMKLIRCYLDVCKQKGDRKVI